MLWRRVHSTCVAGDEAGCNSMRRKASGSVRVRYLKELFSSTEDIAILNGEKR